MTPEEARERVYDEAGLTDDERAAVESQLAIQSWDDLLTPEEREELQRDLFEMARQRRRAEVESRGIEMP